jgi:hypothetical protein
MRQYAFPSRLSGYTLCRMGVLATPSVPGGHPLRKLGGVIVVRHDSSNNSAPTGSRHYCKSYREMRSAPRRNPGSIFGLSPYQVGALRAIAVVSRSSRAEQAWAWAWAYALAVPAEFGPPIGS